MVNDSQVSYRAMVATYEAWTPHRVWLGGYSYDRASRDFQPPGDSRVLDCQELLYAGGKLCRDGGAHPSQVVAADLAKIRRK